MRGIEELEFTIAGLHAAYAAGTSPASVLDEVARRIAAADDPGIFLALASSDALQAEATRLPPFDPEVMPLWGIPVAVKDNIDVAGLPTTAACPAFAYLPERDAECVARLRRAGALVVGKTNLDQFATGLAGVRTPHKVPLNPLDPALVPGGSSSGSAVAVARGIVPLALGTDTAGSGRVPAALNNIVGLKPSVGAISTRGVVPACRTLDCVSVLGLTVEDAWTAFAAIAGFDAEDPFSRALPAPSLAPLPPAIRVGVPRPEDRRFFDDGATSAAYGAALADLQGLDAHVTPIPFTDFYAAAALLYDGAWVAERYLAVRELLQHRPEALHPVTRAILGGGATHTAADAFAGLYELKAIARRIEPLWSEVDCLAVPSVPFLCTLAEIEADPIGANSRLGTYTNFVNLLDFCAIAVPTAASARGRPASITLIARAGEDGRIAALAAALHRRTAGTLGATDWRPPKAGDERAAVSAARPDSIAIAVVGAHLSGMPLNGQLLELGAAFVRATRTAAAYHLYALAGAVPPKPGLLRAPPGEGRSIEVEVLPPEGFARLVAAIPPPLSIGTLALDDGSEVKGFLVEAAAVAGARDISQFGGWRTFVSGTAETVAVPRHRSR